MNSYTGNQFEVLYDERGRGEASRSWVSGFAALKEAQSHFDKCLAEIREDCKWLETPIESRSEVVAGFQWRPDSTQGQMNALVLLKNF
jgi:hypothetical protein